MLGKRHFIRHSHYITKIILTDKDFSVVATFCGCRSDGPLLEEKNISSDTLHNKIHILTDNDLSAETLCSDLSSNFRSLMRDI